MSTVRQRSISAVAPASRVGRGLNSSPSPRRHGAQTWTRSPRSPVCSPFNKDDHSSRVNTFAPSVTKEHAIAAQGESDLVAGKPELKEAASISGKDFDLMIKSGALDNAVHNLGGPVWANVAMLLCHWWWAAYVPSYMRIPTFLPAWMGAGQEAPYELRASLTGLLVVVGIVHHAAPILHLRAGVSFDVLDKLFGAMLLFFIAVGIPCLFCSYYDIFQAKDDATVWYALIAAMVLTVGVFPEVAKPLCLIKQGPTPERLALPELYKQASTEKWAWTWHVVLDLGPSLMYLATWLAMPDESKAKLLAWAF